MRSVGSVVVDDTLLLARLALSAVFVVAAVGKALDQAGTSAALEQFGFSRRAAGWGRLLLPAGELGIGLGLLVAPLARGAAIAALGLLVAFFVAIARVMRAGAAPDCHCFGQVHSRPAGAGTLVRIVAVASLAGLIVLAGAGSRLDPADQAALATVLLTAAVIVLAALVLALWQESRRRREPGPSVSRTGSLAPSLQLEDLGGDARALHDELDPSVPSLLVFVSPGCEPCRTLAPILERWRISVREQLNVVTLASGAADSQPQEFRSSDLGLRLLIAADALEDYGVHSTPAAVLVGVDRRIASRPAEGIPAIEALVRVTLAGAAAGHPGLVLR